MDAKPATLTTNKPHHPAATRLLASTRFPWEMWCSRHRWAAMVPFWVTGALDQIGFQLQMQKYTAEQERLCFLWGAEWYINSRLGLEVSKSDFFWKQVVKKRYVEHLG